MATVDAIMDKYTIETRYGVDVGFHDSNLHPKTGEGRVGKHGLDKTLSLDQIINIAYKMDEKPNIIIKSGPNAKWYLKKCPLHLIDTRIEEVKKQNWRNTSRYIMYIINWDTPDTPSKIEIKKELDFENYYDLGNFLLIGELLV